MKINEDHMFHGAALTQIAEHPSFTAINAIRFGGVLSRSAFKVNDSIGVYLKYAKAPKPPADDYIFTFSQDNKDELVKLNQKCHSLFIAMICVEDRQICCIKYSEFQNWLRRREAALGHDEEASTILVGLPTGKKFRVNMNQPGRRKLYLHKAQLVPRCRFPECLFEDE